MTVGDSDMTDDIAGTVTAGTSTGAYLPRR
jgi:hypothetical protein